MNILSFLIEHWFLASIFLSLTSFWLYLEMKGRGQLVDTTLAVSLLNQNKALLLDMRPAAAFKEGHINGSTCLDEVKGGKEGIVKKLMKSGKQNKSLVLICDNGQSSRRETKAFENLQLTDVSALRGGLMKWREEGLPLESK